MIYGKVNSHYKHSARIIYFRPSQKVIIFLPNEWYLYAKRLMYYIIYHIFRLLHHYFQTFLPSNSIVISKTHRASSCVVHLYRILDQHVRRNVQTNIILENDGKLLHTVLYQLICNSDANIKCINLSLESRQRIPKRS